MGEFRPSNHRFPMPLLPSCIKRYKTIVHGEWYLVVVNSGSKITFTACNNEYREWLWEVKKRSKLFELFFGDIITRIDKAKKKYQRWIDKKNADYFYIQQVSELIQ